MEERLEKMECKCGNKMEGIALSIYYCLNCGRLAVEYGGQIGTHWEEPKILTEEINKVFSENIKLQLDGIERAKKILALTERNTELYTAVTLIKDLLFDFDGCGKDVECLLKLIEEVYSYALLAQRGSLFNFSMDFFTNMKYLKEVRKKTQ